MTGHEASKPDAEELLTIATTWGSFRVPANGFFASVYDPASDERERLEQIRRGSMNLSLGKFQDLLWMLVPESRPMIAESLRKELDEAIEYNLHLNRTSNYALALLSTMN